jgi:tRNA acetyltransferase TAN1
VTNTRNSDRLERLDMIKRVADEIAELGHGHTVDLKSPDRTVLIEVNKVSLRLPQ